MFGCVVCVWNQGKTWKHKFKKIGEGVVTQQNIQNDTCKGKNNESTSSGEDEGMIVICFNIYLIQYPFNGDVPLTISANQRRDHTW